MKNSHDKYRLPHLKHFEAKGLRNLTQSVIGNIFQVSSLRHLNLSTCRRKPVEEVDQRKMKCLNLETFNLHWTNLPIEPFLSDPLPK